MSHPDQQSVCTIAISSSRKEKPLPALERSTLGRWLDARELHAAAQRSRHRRLAPGASCDGSDLTVVLDGELTAGAGDDWRGIEPQQRTDPRTCHADQRNALDDLAHDAKQRARDRDPTDG
jgi:hypothetical protein